MPQRVLCIQSDGPTRALMRRLLESEGLAVDESATGLDGLGRALVLPPDLVLAGTRLPDVEALELVARFKRERGLEHVPFVAVGGPSEHDVAIGAGCDGYIEAPIDEERFAGQVKAYLAGKRERLPEEGERARASFMRDLAHELSTPLTPIAGYLKILQSDKLGALAPQQRKVLDAMASAVTKLTRIVDNLSDFASLQAGQAAIAAAPVDPDQLAEEVVQELRPAIKEARLHAEVRPSRGGPVVADARKLRQAIANVVGNAVKFSPHGGEILIEVTREPQRLRVAVYDQGPGVRTGDAERIFEPFFHAGKAEEARQPGSGLGLPVTRRIAEAHGGRAFVESPPHTQPPMGAHHYTGSKFVVEIPAEPAAVTPPSPAATKLSG